MDSPPATCIRCATLEPEEIAALLTARAVQTLTSDDSLPAEADDRSAKPGNTTGPAEANATDAPQSAAAAAGSGSTAQAGPDEGNEVSDIHESLPADPVQLTLELGRAYLQRDEAASLRPGAVVPLNSRTGDPVELYAGERLVALGEVVVIDKCFGLRITEILREGKRQAA